MSKFLSNAIKLSTATFAGQLLGFIVTPIISRLYSPTDFGIFQLFLSVVNLIGIISCLSYHSAINLPKKHEDAADIVVLCAILILITSIISTIVFLIFSGYIEAAFNTPTLANYILLLPIAIICNSFAYVLIFWLSRKEEFGTIAKGNFFSSVTGKTVTLGSGILAPSPFGLILGTITNDATVAAIALKRTLSDFHLFRNSSFEKIKEVAYRYKKFPKYSAGANLTSTAAVQVTPFMLALFFSPVIVGYYAIAYMVIIIPSKLMGNSVATIFFQKACVEKNRIGSITNIVKTVNTRLISIGIFICLILIIVGPELFSFFLGAKWSTAGVYAQILAPWFFVSFISTPLFSIFNVLEKQGASWWFSLSLLISRIVVLAVGGLLGDPIISMLLLSATGVIFWSWMNMYLLKIAGVDSREAVREIIRHLLLGLTICIPLILAKLYSIPTIPLIIITAAVTIVYYSIVVYRDTQLKEGLLGIIKNKLK
jgi:O-antigen/teichoic acid export membrane protein